MHICLLKEIRKIACLEEPTYILTLEEILHTHYDYKRINGTEWFKDLDFDEVVHYVNTLLSLKSYEITTQVRIDRLNGDNVLNNINEDYD